MKMEVVSLSETINFDHIIHLHILDRFIPLLKMKTVISSVKFVNVYHILYATS